MALSIAPSGRARFVEGPTASLPRGVAEAATAGLGEGLLALAGRPTAGLSPDLAFGRALGERFLTALCRAAHLVGPPEDLDGLLEAAPPLRGVEYLGPATLSDAWEAMARAVAEGLEAHDGEVVDYVAATFPAWSAVGRVVFHLAENRGDPDAPFAFLATYVDGVGPGGAPVHRPLGRALEAYRGDREGLTALLRPLRDAAERSPFVAARVADGDIYHPLRVTPREAHAFLREVPACEEAGVVVRVPDWWRQRRRVRAQGRVGDAAASGMGADALLDFSATLALEGEPLDEAEIASLLRGEPGLRLLKGRWVDVDPERLRALLSHFDSVREAAARGELTFAEGMRLLAGLTSPGELAEEGDDEAADFAAWGEVVAGDWLAARLGELTAPGLEAPEGLRATLRPYQREGVAWLTRLCALGLGGCLADDMGLGKTLQVLAALLHLRGRARRPHLLVVPASLLGNWEQEAARFAPALTLLRAHRSRGDLDAFEEHAGEVDVVLTTYGTLSRTAWLQQRPWHLVVLDEAQAIKNPGTKQTRAVKRLRSEARVALTGTPVENRLGDLWSLFDFLLPGLLGSAKELGQRARRMAEAPDGYAPLRRLVRPYLLRRLKTDPAVAPDLPDKTEVRCECALSRKQAALYDRDVRALAKELEATEEGMKKRGVVLTYLQRLKQICNHPAQRLDEGDFAPKHSGKLRRLAELCEPIAQRQERALVFTQFRAMCAPLASFLAGVFGAPGLVLHGGTPVARRAELVERFQAEDGPPFFVISLKAGGTGLNLTAASHVIHFDRWWNPAVENQATDRAFRIGQRRAVLVHKMVCRGTLEERIDEMIAAKQRLADRILAPDDGERALTELDAEELLALVRRDPRSVLDA